MHGATTKILRLLYDKEQKAGLLISKILYTIMNSSSAVKGWRLNSRANADFPRGSLLPAALL